MSGGEGVSRIDGLPLGGGPWTRHGHPIPGVTVYPTPPNVPLRPPVARCGGVSWCTKCREDAAAATPPPRQAAAGTDGELREAIAATLYAPDEPDLWAGADPEGCRDCLATADALLAGPLAALVADREAVQRVRELHRPWYTVHGVRHDHTVMANCEDFDGCDGTADRECDDAGGHERLACYECRCVVEDMDGNLFWPCPTVRAIDGAET